VANAFNSMSIGVIFLKLCAIGGNIMQLIPFAHAFEFLLFYNHHNCEGDVIVIPFANPSR
jgi:hypothetical protein